jgi:hypothetical protein
MWLLGVSIGAIALALLLHVAIWRVRRPRAQTTALLKLFGACYLVSMALFYWSPASAPWAMDALSLIYFSVFYLPSALTYTSFYSLIEHDSPSIQIVMALDRAGEHGATREELMALFGGDDLVGQRLDAAMQNGLLMRERDGWALTSKGALFGRVFDIASRIYRFDRAG